MSRIPTRTPLVTKTSIKKIGGKAKPKHTEMYVKQMVFTIAGADPKHIQSVAAALHKAHAEHEHVIGGKSKRSVSVSYSSTDPTKIFDGTVRPDGIA
jgi:hypothetical protein